MIWYDDSVTVKNQPEGATVQLVGTYELPSHPTDNIISITLSVTTLAGDIKQKVLYTHDPSMLAREEPAPEDVLTRYCTKVNKIRSKVANSDWDTVISMVK